MNPTEKFPIDFEVLQDFLNQKVTQYNTPEFIRTDPIQIPKMYTQLPDVEISGFLTSVIAWGLRKNIISSAQKMMDLMGNAPYDFVMNHCEKDLASLQNFVHRTFNGTDFVTFIRSLQRVYKEFSTLENAFAHLYQKHGDLQKGISEFKKIFFDATTPQRTLKHLPDPEKGSAAKRMNMMLRWFVRKDSAGVDLGIWEKIPASALSCPLDVHSARVGRALGLITRKQNDAKALAQLSENLKLFCPEDPAKYDFALFGLGIFENFSGF